MMKKMLGRVLDGLDAHCRTGKRVGKKGVLEDPKTGEPHEAREIR